MALRDLQRAGYPGGFSFHPGTVPGNYAGPVPSPPAVAEDLSEYPENFCPFDVRKKQSCASPLGLHSSVLRLFGFRGQLFSLPRLFCGQELGLKLSTSRPNIVQAILFRGHMAITLAEPAALPLGPF